MKTGISRHLTVTPPSLYRFLFSLSIIAFFTVQAGFAQELSAPDDEQEVFRVPRVGVAQVFAGDDARLAAVAESLTNTVELNLRLLGRYEVHRLGAPDPADEGLESQREWAATTATEQILDYVLLGTAESEDTAISIELTIYDREEDQLTVDATERVESIFDLFDAADKVTTALLEAFSGEIIVFGTLSIQPDNPGNYTVFIDGTEIGPNIREQRVLAGSRSIEITQDRMFETHTIHTEAVRVYEARTEPVRFEIPLLLPDEAAAIAELENQIDELWNLPAAQSEVEQTFEELEQLLTSTPFAPALGGELQRVQEARAAYLEHAADGFPFDPERVRMAASFDRLRAEYGFVAPDAQEAPSITRPGPFNRLDTLSGGSAVSVRLGAGFALGSDYDIPGVSSAARQDLDGFGSFAGAGLEYAPGGGVFHGLLNLEYGIGGESVGPLDAGNEAVSYAYRYAGAGVGLSYEVINRLGLVAELEYGLQSIEYKLGDGLDGHTMNDPTEGRAAVRGGLRFAVSPRFDLQVVYELQPRGVLRQTVGLGVVSRIGPSRDRRRNPALDREYPLEYAVAMNEATLNYSSGRFLSAYYGYRNALAHAQDEEQLAFANAAMARSRFEYEAQHVGQRFDGIETTLQHYLELRALDRGLAAELNYLVRATPNTEGFDGEELREFRQALRWFE